jgi:hypothetical protein
MLLIQIQVSGDRPPPNLPLQATRIAYRHSEKPVALEVVRWKVKSTFDDQSVDDDGPGTPAPPPVPDADAPTVDDTSAPESPVAPAAEGPESEPTAEPIPVPTSRGPAPEAVAPPTDDGDRAARVRLLAVLTFPDTDELEVHLTFGGRRIIGRATASKGILAVVEAMVDGLTIFVPRLEFTPTWARALDDDRGRDVHVVACELKAPDESRRLGIASGASAIEAAARATLHALNRSISEHLAADQPGDS